METKVKIPEIFATQLQRGEMRIGETVTEWNNDCTEREREIELHINFLPITRYIHPWKFIKFTFPSLCTQRVNKIFIPRFLCFLFYFISRSGCHGSQLSGVDSWNRIPCAQGKLADGNFQYRRLISRNYFPSIHRYLSTHRGSRETLFNNFQFVHSM